MRRPAVVGGPSEAPLAATKENLVVERLPLKGCGVIIKQAVEAKLH